ncbi:MAG: nucleotidyl transferase AbiEii/AbiGii toxin family protein [Ruminococcaceae bacterium]|nr:nucleotidyl transferase AbiEii/AbiGii toxin family protein [Oscillospiraceae bacterium]
MRLHEFTTEFRDLISIVAADKHLPESAIERDYYIVLLLKNLADSEYVEKCVFKGGTSLSKCYPGSIERFSEDIDLTFLGIDETDKDELKRLIDITKQTDSYYLEKRNISQEYDPTGTYNFGVWKHYLNDQVRSTYENLHKELLYTDEQQSFDDALSVFSQISEILNDIGE